MKRLSTINKHSLLSKYIWFVVIPILILILIPINVQAEPGQISYLASGGNYSITDEGGLDNRAIWEINLTGAPTNSVITSVDVEYWINHTYISDLKVWLTTEENGQWIDYVLWDRAGGGTDNIHEKETGITAWNELSANRKWYLNAADFTAGDEGEITEWQIWVNYTLNNVTPQSLPYHQNFSSGKPDVAGSWEYYSNNRGFIEVVDGQLRMGEYDFQDSLNEAILHLDLNGRSGVVLTLDHISNRDENNSLPSSFKDHFNGDGIAFSADGINWYLLTNLTDSFNDQSFDLDSAVKSAGISYNSDFRIKFQQYDDFPWGDDGRAFDEISVTATSTDPSFKRPFGTWKGTFNSTKYSTTGTISNWIMRENYTTQSIWELHAGDGAGIRINATGTYTYNTTNNRLDFIYSGPATTWADEQTTTVPCILNVTGTASTDRASGNYEIKLFPQNLPQVVDTGTWLAIRVPTINSHIFGIEMCVGYNYNDASVGSDTTYDFCLGIETDNTVDLLQFQTPASFTFQIPADSHTQSGEIQTWHYATEAIPSEMSPSNLVAYWEMDDDASNTRVVDSSGKGNHGAARRNTSSLTTAGMIDNALNFNGSSDYVNCGHDNSLDLTNNFTIAAWVKPHAFSRLAGIVSKYHTAGASSYFLRMDSASPYNKVQFGGKSWVTSSGTLSRDQWCFIVGIRDAGTGKIYINGNLDASRSISVSSSSDSVYIGMDYKSSPRYFNGAIDNVMIFDKVLSDEEIKTLYDRNQVSRERWEYKGKFANNIGLSKYGNGTYTIIVQYKDGTQGQTTVRFGIPESSDYIAQPTQMPVLTSPQQNKTIISPVTFGWLPCLDTDVTAIELSLEKTVSGEFKDIEQPVNATSTDPIPLSSGSWTTKIFFDNWYDFNNTDGIFVEVGKYSESDYYFDILDMSMVGHWKMDDDASNTRVVDSSGKGNHGAARRNTSSLTTAGMINNALNFNGSSDYVNCGHDNSLDLTNNFTIAAWVKPHAFSRLAGIVSKYHTAGASSYFLRMDSASPYNKIQFGGKSWVTSSGTLSRDQWCFIVGVRDAGTGKIYINGNLDASRSISVSSSSDSVYIGMDYKSSPHYFNGAIDNVMIFDTVLSGTEINTIYQNGLEHKTF